MPKATVLHRLLATFLTCLALIVINGCSEGSPGGGGIGGTGIPQPSNSEGLIIGRVGGFGSIIINDRRFETDNADFLVDGDTAALTDIQIGMKVSARVNYASETASSVYYQPAVVGTVENFDGSASTMIVLGQKVQLSQNTVLDGFTTVSLVDGVAVEVNGDRDQNNVIVADYIKLVEDAKDFYTVGEVDEENTGIEHLALISGSLVNFSQLAEDLGLSASAFAEIYLTPGTLLRSGANKEAPQLDNCTSAPATVETIDSESTNILFTEMTPESGNEGNTTANTLDGIDQESCILANSVNVVDRIVFTSDDRIEMVGLVTSVRDDSSFVAISFTVFTDDDTLFFNQFGIQIRNAVVQNNEIVLINGIANSNGEVVADSIVLLDRL